MSIYVGRKEKETSGDIFPKYEVVNEVNERLANESELNLYFSTIDEGLTNCVWRCIIAYGEGTSIRPLFRRR